VTTVIPIPALELYPQLKTCRTCAQSEAAQSVVGWKHLDSLAHQFI